MEDFIKRKMDLEAASTLLTKALTNLNESIQNYTNREGDFGKMMNEKHSMLTICKENIDFVIAVLTDYINQHPVSSSKRIDYIPRRITSIYDIGKYQTEALKAKRLFEPLTRIASYAGDKEKEKLYQECITKLNYVYANIAKTK